MLRLQVESPFNAQRKRGFVFAEGSPSSRASRFAHSRQMASSSISGETFLPVPQSSAFDHLDAELAAYAILDQSYVPVEDRDDRTDAAEEGQRLDSRRVIESASEEASVDFLVKFEEKTATDSEDGSVEALGEGQSLSNNLASEDKEDNESKDENEKEKSDAQLALQIIPIMIGKLDALIMENGDGECTADTSFATWKEEVSASMDVATTLSSNDAMEQFLILGFDVFWPLKIAGNALFVAILTIGFSFIVFVCSTSRQRRTPINVNPSQERQNTWFSLPQNSLLLKVI
ncbi:hypothetical protein IV203_003796 [Nitzschia inconspicua]|uniref:Uncharacterized protein n=1 Tax=Nitzschia inconspicua TaxID=303405 RepID=A0A9K3L2F7_9STRA|nr:hypothetical protein IV203_003796 [Nitzschia inconspicua]